MEHTFSAHSICSATSVDAMSILILAHLTTFSLLSPFSPLHSPLFCLAVVLIHPKSFSVHQKLSCPRPKQEYPRWSCLHQEESNICFHSARKWSGVEKMGEQEHLFYNYNACFLFFFFYTNIECNFSCKLD